jgi:hypothetical protein
MTTKPEIQPWIIEAAQDVVQRWYVKDACNVAVSVKRCAKVIAAHLPSDPGVPINIIKELPTTLRAIRDATPGNNDKYESFNCCIYHIEQAIAEVEAKK